MLSKLRDPVSGLTHLGGAIAAFFGQIALLIVGWSGTAKVVSVIIYGLSLIGLFAASATYHMTKAKPAVIAVLRKIDHAAIFLLIAGTYTPFCILAFTGFYRWGLLAIIWTIAVIGILLKVFVPGMPRWLHTLLYVIMGWMCLSAVGQMPSALTTWEIFWLIAGGVIYTVGAVIYATKKMDFFPGKFGFHEVWHIFVLLGALAHFAAIASLVAAAG